MTAKLTAKSNSKSKSTSKSKKARAVKTESVAIEKAKVLVDVDADIQVKISEKDFITRLTEKLTHFDATMVLEAAMLTAGVARQEGNFKKREAREICLALIKRGGPAFAVGTGIYREVIG